MKYPLTNGAKTAAKEIVTAWDSGVIDQRIHLIIFRGGDQETPQIFNQRDSDIVFESPSLGIWWELSKFNLGTVCKL